MQSKNFSFLKMIVFLIFFLVVLTFFLIIYIIPAMKEYKTNEKVLKKYERLHKKQLHDIKVLQAKINMLQKKYKNDIKRYNQPFDKDDFSSFVKNYIHDPSIKEKKSKSQDKVFVLEGNIDDISDFYRFSEELNNYPSIVKITFPITIKKEEKSYYIKLSVTVINKKLKKAL